MINTLEKTKANLYILFRIMLARHSISKSRKLYKHLKKSIQSIYSPPIRLNIQGYISHLLICYIWITFIGESSNGRTTDFDSVCLGSNPSSPKSFGFKQCLGFFCTWFGLDNKSTFEYSYTQYPYILAHFWSSWTISILITIYTNLKSENIFKLTSITNHAWK